MEKLNIAPRVGKLIYLALLDMAMECDKIFESIKDEILSAGRSEA